MKKVKITITAIVDNDRVDELDNEILDQLGVVPKTWLFSSTVVQNIDRKKGRFKAGQVYKINEPNMNNSRWLLIIGAGSKYIKGIILNKENINIDAFNNCDIAGIDFNTKYYFYYKYENIFCDINFYNNKILGRFKNIQMNSEEIIAVKNIEYICDINDHRLAEILIDEVDNK